MLTAEKLMNRSFLSVSPDLTVEELALLLEEKAAPGAVVVDEKGNLLGVVTESDLVSKEKNIHLPTIISLFGAAIYLESSSLFREELRKMAASRVADIFTKDPVTLSPGDLLADIATVMAERGIHFLPVLDGGRLAGVVTRREIIHALAGGGG